MLRTVPRLTHDGQNNSPQFSSHIRTHEHALLFPDALCNREKPLECWEYSPLLTGEYHTFPPHCISSLLTAQGSTPDMQTHTAFKKHPQSIYLLVHIYNDKNKKKHHWGPDTLRHFYLNPAVFVLRFGRPCTQQQQPFCLTPKVLDSRDRRVGFWKRAASFERKPQLI